MIKVFVGTNSDIQQLAEKVVKYSILKNTSSPVDIQFIQPGWKVGPTGFTTHRFLIPEICNYQGFAIYLDVDMLILGDIEELWAYQQSGKWCTTKLRDDVSVIDCSAFKDIPKNDVLRKCKNKQWNKTGLRNLIKDRHVENIPIVWNWRRDPIPETKLIHYTKLNTQPWKPHPNIQYKPFKKKEAKRLFFQYLEEAEAHGY